MVPFYTYHQKQVTDLYGSEPLYIETNPDWTPNWDNIKNTLANGLDLLLLTNPGNPQGNVWHKEDMQRLVKMTTEAKCILLLDEIYVDLVWKGTFYSPIQDGVSDYVVVCRGFAKNVGCQSWRCGYLISSPQRADQIMRLHDPIYISVSWQQHSLAKYFTQDFDDFVRHVNATGELMQNNWKVLSKALQKVLGWTPIDPEGSMYGMFKHNVGSDREAVAAGLQHGVGVAPGRIFYPGLPKNTGYVRIHCGISAEKARFIVETLEKSHQISSNKS